MTAAAGIAYGVSFALGPALYALLMRIPAKRLWYGTMLAAIGLASVLSLALQDRDIVLFGLPPGLPLLATLWLTWVLVITLFAGALQHRLDDQRARRMAFVAGLLATTLPWFGLAAATSVGG